MSTTRLRLTLGLGVIALTACTPQAPVATGPSPREIELSKEVDELKGKLSTAEQAVEAAKAEGARKVDQLALELAKLKKTLAEAAAAKAEVPIKDTSYVVVKKLFTPGQLVAKRTSGNPNGTERVPAVHKITFKGAQTGREYPPLDVQENAFAGFREGAAYAAIDLVRAKKAGLVAGTTMPAAGTSSGGDAGSGTVLSAEEARSIFGD